MKHQVLFCLQSNEKVFMNVVSAVAIGALRVKSRFSYMVIQFQVATISSCNH